ncbi:reversion-inducing cysteine-rich protein with Kazal motifs-like [Cottoperca gobio]|uniref:Reversion-inducing cysteine-rich protein with Kazal motifs n=1 Tax=Cottoperca gobio TaxID=56716 RepID=A0A6J2PEF5_COTGO|nr:reversion-inducing cysteine-rich protein with Kazal motifs-like [Cottoperca gobio]
MTPPLKLFVNTSYRVCLPSAGPYPSACVAQLHGLQGPAGFCSAWPPHSCPDSSKTLPEGTQRCIQSTVCVERRVGLPAVRVRAAPSLTIRAVWKPDLPTPHGLVYPSVCPLQQPEKIWPTWDHCQEPARSTQPGLWNHNGETYTPRGDTSPRFRWPWTTRALASLWDGLTGALNLRAASTPAHLTLSTAGCKHHHPLEECEVRAVLPERAAERGRLRGEAAARAEGGYEQLQGGLQSGPPWRMSAGWWLLPGVLQIEAATPSSLGNSIVEEVIHPCNPNPCPSNHVCQVNRRGCLDDLHCQPYICVPGCKLGEASEFLVQQDSRIQVPTRSGPSGCHEVCSCGVSGRLENCVEMPCVDTDKPCSVAGQRKSHGTSFRMDCHVCSCFAGDTICSKRQCLGLNSSEEDRRRFTGLPCSCPYHFIPVCASNGRTYPSACVARCMGFKDQQFVFGVCRLTLPCSSKLCQRNQRCIPKYRVCLSDASDCLQYECVGRPPACDKSSVEPACDTDGLVYPSVCQLQQAGKNLAYMGHCQDACKKPQQVCGHNGETYSTVCDAFSDRVAVDYEGSCIAVGVSDGGPDSACSEISCPPLSTAGCKPITPPGACCPICAAMLQILWNKEQMNTFSKLNKNQPVTVRDVLLILRLHVSVPQCDVFGYLSINHELVVLIAPVDQQPTPLQIEACSMEAEKIYSLINYASPTLVSHVPLSAFLSSEIQTSSIHSSGGAPPSPLPPGLSLLLGLLVAAGPVLQQL